MLHSVLSRSGLPNSHRTHRTERCPTVVADDQQSPVAIAGTPSRPVSNTQDRTNQTHFLSVLYLEKHEPGIQQIKSRSEYPPCHGLWSRSTVSNGRSVFFSAGWGSSTPRGNGNAPEQATPARELHLKATRRDLESEGTGFSKVGRKCASVGRRVLTDLFYIESAPFSSGTTIYPTPFEDAYLLIELALRRRIAILCDPLRKRLPHPERVVEDLDSR